MLKAFSSSYFSKKTFLLGLLLILPFVLLEIWAVNRLSTLGAEINKMETTAASLRLENQVLATQIAKKSALIEIEKSAQLLGFEKVKSVQQVELPNLALGH